MTGMNLYNRFKVAESTANELGFMFCYSKHRYDDSGSDIIGLKPMDNRLLIYSRDAELFSGTLSQVEQFLQGFTRAYSYLGLLGACDSDRIAKCEEKYRADVEKRRIAEEKKQLFKTLKNKEMNNGTD